jgi:hypothetical protein
LFGGSFDDFAVAPLDHPQAVAQVFQHGIGESQI